MDDRRLLVGSRALVCLLILGSLGAASAAAQPARAADGHRSLEGVWTHNAATPLERPAALKDKPLLTDDEVLELTRRAARYVADPRNDFAAGDVYYLTLLNPPEVAKFPNSTGGADAHIDKIIENRTSLIVDPADGRMPAWTPDGQHRWDVQRQQVQALHPDGPEDLPNYVRCVTYGVPRIGGNSTDYSNYYQIVQTGDYVVLYGEANHDARIVALDGRPHLPAAYRRWNGDSIGHWEGDTLVVDTTNFAAGSRFMGAGENLHLVERFTRASADVIDYEITLDDATTWTRPWTALVHLRRSGDRMYEFACSEGSGDVIAGILSGARALERSTEDPTRKPRH
jgi:hypothetical protein